MALPLISTDARNTYEDLSGVTVQAGDNPYEALITASQNDPSRVQARYSTHRTTRNAQQRARFLAPNFTEVLVDPFLLRIEDPRVEPGWTDPRHCLVFWARPPEHILHLAARVQERLRQAAPHLWLMPLYRMHMTALEIAHSRTPAEADSLVRTMAAPHPATQASGIATLVNHPYQHRARLVRPMVSYDLAAVALSFVPAAGEPSASPPPVPPGCVPMDGAGSDVLAGATDDASAADAYTYHHLRRDLFAHARATGVDIASRYVVPSAHITLARFLCQDDHATPAARQAWVDALDETNVWLEQEVWPAVWQPATPEQAPPPRDRLVGEWIVGQEKGLDCRTGALWYGHGRTVQLGEGF